MIRPAEVFKTIDPGGGADRQKLALDWKVDPSLPYFDGHFPGTPILPAIAIIDASTYILQRALDQANLRLKSVVNAKFLSPIQPGLEVHIELEKLGEDEWQIEWKELGGEGPLKLLATLRVQL